MFRDSITAKTEISQPSWESVAIAYGIIVFQFDVHPTLLSVQVDMHDKLKVGRSIIASYFGECETQECSNLNCWRSTSIFLVYTCDPL